MLSIPHPVFKRKRHAFDRMFVFGAWIEYTTPELILSTTKFSSFQGKIDDLF